MASRIDYCENCGILCESDDIEPFYSWSKGSCCDCDYCCAVYCSECITNHHCMSLLCCNRCECQYAGCCYECLRDGIPPCNCT